MKNHSSCTASLHKHRWKWSFSHLITFEAINVLNSIMIIVVNVLVLRHIYGKTRRSRADLMFLVLSIYDIGVGLLSQTAIGMFSWCTSYINCGCSNSFLSIIVFFAFFAYIFSHMLTADRQVPQQTGYLLQQYCSFMRILLQKNVKGYYSFCSCFIDWMLCLDCLYVLRAKVWSVRYYSLSYQRNFCWYNYSSICIYFVFRL